MVSVLGPYSLIVFLRHVNHHTLPAHDLEHMVIDSFQVVDSGTIFQIGTKKYKNYYMNLKKKDIFDDSLVMCCVSPDIS
jgi:hypothetical protein